MKKTKMILTALLTGTLFVSSIGTIGAEPIQAEAKSSVKQKTKKTLNLRTKANYKKSTRILVKIPKNSEVKRIKTVKNGKTRYAYVSYKTLSGKTYKGFISNKHFRTVKTSKYVKSNASNKNYRTTAGMYVRKAPDTNVNNKKLKFVKKGTNVKIRGYRTVNNAKFMYVDSGSTRGYLNAKYLTKVASEYGTYKPINYDQSQYAYTVISVSSLYPTIKKAKTLLVTERIPYTGMDFLSKLVVLGSQTYKGETFYKVTRLDSSGGDKTGWINSERIMRYKAGTQPVKPNGDY